MNMNLKEQTHFDLGMALLSRFESQVFGDEEKGDILLVILDLINHGVPSLLQGKSGEFYVMLFRCSPLSAPY